jgi:glycerate dehydrogenase
VNDLSTKIVVLDGYTLNPGDLDWGSLRRLGPCVIYDRTSHDKVIERTQEASIVLTNKVPLPADILSQLPALKYIGVLATGYNVVDVSAAKTCGIIVSNVPSYGTQSVAQTVFAHLMNFTQHVAAHSHAVANGRWASNPDWSFWDTPLVELAGLSIGIVGLGRIGRCVAKIADVFGMHVLAFNHRPTQAPEYVRLVGLRELYMASDVISLHCPLTSHTHHMIDAKALGLMKSTAWLINTSRGLLIDEYALADALNSGRLAGAGLDVLSIEPPYQDNPLLSTRNCQITPHLAWATNAARARLLKTVVDNVAAFLAGQPQNVVN